MNQVDKFKMKKSLLTERFQQLAGIKPLYEIEGLNENIQQYIDGEDDISDIRRGERYKTIRIDFNRKIKGRIKDEVEEYIYNKYGHFFRLGAKHPRDIELDWRDDYEVEIHIKRTSLSSDRFTPPPAPLNPTTIRLAKDVRYYDTDGKLIP